MTDPYVNINPEELILRDWLAAERTELANERTLLAYLRTALAFFATGLGLIKLFETTIAAVIGITFLACAGFLFVVGIWRWRKVRASLPRRNIY